MYSERFKMGKKKIAMCYDVDNTLIDGFAPSLILEARGIDVNEFWKRVTRLQERERKKGENENVHIIYLAQFMHEVRHGQLKGLTLKDIKEAGKGLETMLFPGLPEFFTEIQKANPRRAISHNAISGGIKPLLEKSVLGRYMDRIYGYTFFDNLTEGPEIDEIKSTSSTHDKVPAIVGISYGNNGKRYEYPIRNMIYFGDGQTDIPVFKFVTKRDGLAICVFDPDKGESYDKAKDIQRQVPGLRIAPANYEVGSEIWEISNERLKIKKKDSK